MKAADLRRENRRRAERPGSAAAQGSVQPALPAGERAAGEHGAAAPGAARHRPREDHSGERRRRASAKAPAA